MLEAPDLLEKAAATMRERSAERDNEKERAMASTIAMFNAAFPKDTLTEYQGWMFMFFLKIARANGGSFREDDYVDGAAYVALAGECRALDQQEATLSAELQAEVDRASVDPRTIAQTWKD